MQRSGRKIVLLALAGLVGLLVTLYATLTEISLDSFTRVEHQLVVDHTLRAQDFLLQNTADLARTLADWSDWDDTYQFLQSGDGDFVEKNLIQYTFNQLDLDAALFVDRRGRIAGARAFDPARTREVPVPPELLELCGPDGVLLRHSRSPSLISGLLSTSAGPLLVASRPVVRSDGSGPFVGVAIFARHFPVASLARLAAVIRVNRLELLPLASIAPSAAVREALARVSHRRPIAIEPLSDRLINGLMVLNDLSGEPAFVLRVQTGRPVYRHARETQRYLAFALGGIGLLFGGALVLLLFHTLASRDRQRQTERLYHAYVAQTVDGVLLVDAESLTVLDANPAALRLLDQDSAVGTRSITGLVRTDRSDLLGALSRLEETEHVSLGQFTHERRDGTTIELEVRASLISHDARRIYSLLLHDISARKAAEEQVRFFAFHDALTQLPNRRLFEDRLRMCLARARREGQTVGVVFIDLDHLKEVNDSLGHDAGDRLLIEVAQRLRTNLRDCDTLARVGGDEFLALLPGVSHPVDTVTVCDRLLQAVRAPLTIAGRELVTTASMGVAIFPGDGEEARDLLRHADLAMYNAKERGRDCWRLYNDGMNEHLLDLADLRAALEQAVLEDQLVLHYQPQVRASDGRVVGLEALLRWQRPGENELLQPRHFLPAAEQNGAILLIGEWVIRSVCAQLRRWLDDGLRPPPVAINLSPRQFTQQDVVAVVQRALADHRLEAGLLELELSEDAAMKSPEQALRVLGNLHDLGVTLALDDFGVGISSLVQLRRLPLRRLKIDRSLILALPGEEAAEVVRLLLDVAHSLRLEAVAEGVESYAAGALLEVLGCPVLQGYAYGEPLPAAQVPQRLLEVRRPTPGGGQATTQRNPSSPPAPLAG